ncbi:glycoside hydrolase family 3 C-terminal domain-containing protein [Paenibacillus fonticola]|uniref:glycoside hydrolase family 3 C-terminal domain-containing protein n=1 Tax=Paenibacillus fonticola TaxID=379896 RepID=UPI00036B204E|nr:glycoside hydrolase family 3 C-terminal domain-containing protein [Paenibacillus fonticola]
MKRDLKSLVAQMTLEEKAGLCSGLDFWHLKGIERLGIPSIMVTDGPHGLRKQAEGADHLGLNQSVPATCFPSAVGLASTWNRELIGQVGKALGKECQAENVAVLLGPGANIKRSPLCGRNFEYFSEDPFLSSEMAASHITGVQSQGVGTSLKHFAVNNQEHRRMSTDAIVGERALREIYLASFEGAVKKAQPWTVMCAYNKVNGEYASENKRLLTDILREEWGFEGVVVSDWGAVNERVQALTAGLELEMPSSSGAGEQKIIAAIQDGTLAAEVLDQAVERLLGLIFKAVDYKQAEAAYDQEDHHRLAREAACESMVLLKNEDQLLPLAKEGTIAVIGAFAKEARYQGGGSSHILPTKLDNIYDEIVQAVAGADVLYAQGYPLEHDDIDHKLIEQAKETAGKSEAAVLFIGLPDRYESEGYDREHLSIPANQLALIEAVASVQPNLIAVLSNGAPIEMPWLPKVKSVLEGYLGGQALGGAIASLLFGDANPSGKLAETFPVKLSDNPSYLHFPGDGDVVEYGEGIFVGYRYYDTKNIEPLFPFGHGLSYTEFSYRNLSISSKQVRDTEPVEISVNVKNVGARAGKEIVQLYIKDVQSSVSRPEKELKGFEKVHLEPGEETKVTFTLDRRSFAYYDVSLKDWHVEAGEFKVLIGKSSREIVIEESLFVTSTTPVKKIRVDRNTLVGDLLADPLLSSRASQMLDKINETHPFAQMAGDGNMSDMLAAMMKYMPLRALANFSGGTFTEEMLEDMIAKLNEVSA